MDLTQHHFALFAQPVSFDVDSAALAERFRALQQQWHPDRFASADSDAQREAMQYSAHINEAYAVLKSPMRRALYLLELEGLDEQAVMAHKPDGAFMLQQMQWRESLEQAVDAQDVEDALDELWDEASAAMAKVKHSFATHYLAKQSEHAAVVAVQMQYIDKFLTELEQAQAAAQA